MTSEKVVNSAPTGFVVISGTPTQGQTLTAINTLVDVDGLGTFSYQWSAAGVAISGATSNTFTLTAAQVGKTVTGTVRYTDGHGTLESVSSTATTIVTALDISSPVVLTVNPAYEMPVGANIILTFNEDIARGTGNILLKTAAGVTVATYDAATSANLTLSGSTLTINPSADLGAGTSYKVEFATGSIKDLAGNAYTGTTSYNFSTATGTTPIPTPTPATNGATQAKVYLGQTDNFTLSNTGATLYGNTGVDVVTLTSTAAGVVLDQNVDHIRFANTVDSYTFRQTGNKINVYDASGSTLLVSVPLQSDADGTLLGFANGTASATLSAGVMTLGGAILSGVTPGALTPALGTNPPPPSAQSTAKVYMAITDSFTLNSSGTTLYGNTGIDKVTLASGVGSTLLDQNVDEVVFLSASGNYAFKQTGNKINVYDASGITLLTSLPVQSDADGTVLTFSNGSASVKLSAGVMTFGLSTVSGTAATPLLPFGASTVNIAADGSSSAAGADQTYTLALGNYIHTISGFGTGDKLAFPAGNAPSVNNSSYTDGTVELTYASSGNIMTIRLTGLASATDQLLNNAADFNLVFGAGSVY